VRIPPPAPTYVRMRAQCLIESPEFTNALTSEKYGKMRFGDFNSRPMLYFRFKLLRWTIRFRKLFKLYILYRDDKERPSIRFGRRFLTEPKPHLLLAPPN
jgi:hypothetical protein